MKKYALPALILLLGFTAWAVADFAGTAGSGLTFFDFTCFTTKHCTAFVPIDSAGAEKGTTANPVSVGGVTTEVCASMTVTTGSAYTAGNVVGGTLTLASLVRAPLTGILQSVRMSFRETITAEFDVSMFQAAPATTFTDKSAPAISTADSLLAMPPIKLTVNSTLLGANATIYGQDGINRAIKLGATTASFVITTPGTPTFGNANPQFCASVQQD